MAILKVLIPVFVLAVLAASFYWALDPKETEKQKIDALKKDDAISLVGAISGFYSKTSVFPWDGKELSWTTASKIKIDELIRAEFLEKSPQAAEEIYVARGGGENDKVWACFLPVSKHERVDPVKLKSLTPGTPMPARPAGGPEDGEPNECLNSPDWQNSFCFVCVAK